MARAKTRVPIKPPKSLGACADVLWDMQQKRYALQHDVTAMKADETVIKDHLIANVAAGDEGAVGSHHVATIEPAVVPQIEDWDKVCAWMIKKKDFSIIKREIIASRVADLMDEGIKIPGIVGFTVKKVHLSKRAR